MNIIFTFSRRTRVWMLVGSCLLFGTLLRAEQEMETLAAFTGDNGMQPEALVQATNGDFYGTTSLGGKNNMGTIFRLIPGHDLETIVDFAGKNGSSPSPRLVVAEDGNIYGSTEEGGANNFGTVFKITSDGVMQTIASFDETTGKGPQADLVVEPNGMIYGCTGRGGKADKGTLFTIGPDHKITTLVSFTGENGEYPQGLSSGSDGKFHGVTCSGGVCNSGTVFTADTEGHLSTVCSFSTEDASAQHSRMAEASDGDFYGTSFNGGQSGMGSVYSISRSGVVTHFQNFNEGSGFHPGPDLVEWNNGSFYIQQLFRNEKIKSSTVQWLGLNFCGTTINGGAHGNGTVFRITADGRLGTLVSFTGTQGKNPGSSPNSILPGEDGNLYGTTAAGGPSDKGTIFRLRVAAGDQTDSPYHHKPEINLPILASVPIVSH